MRRIARVLALAAGTLTMVGCWPVPGQNADRTGHNPFEQQISPATVGELTLDWETPRADIPILAPVVSSAGVHVAVGGCGVATLAPGTGAGRWTELFDGLCEFDPTRSIIRYASPPFVAPGGRVLAGVFWWLRPAPSPQFDWFTSGFDVATGAAAGAWDPVIAGIRGDDALFVSPLIRTIPPGIPLGFGPMAFASFGPLDGSLRTIRTAVSTSEDTVVSGIPTLGDTMLFHVGTGTLATSPGDEATGLSVRAYSRSASRPGCGPAATPVECPLWSTPVDAVASASPVIGPGQETVYVVTEAGTIYALDAATGAVEWTAHANAAVVAEPALADGVLYVATLDGRLLAFSADGCGAATCDLLWGAVTGTGVRVQPSVAGGVVFVGTVDGNVLAYDAAGCGTTLCPRLWSASTGSEITGAPAVSNGSVFVGTADGRVVAYR